MVKQQTSKKVISLTDLKLYTFEALIISGPMTKNFIKNNRVVSRTVQILGEQTLEQLHKILFVGYSRSKGLCRARHKPLLRLYPAYALILNLLLNLDYLLSF